MRGEEWREEKAGGRREGREENGGGRRERGKRRGDGEWGPLVSTGNTVGVLLWSGVSASGLRDPDRDLGTGRHHQRTRQLITVIGF